MQSPRVSGSLHDLLQLVPKTQCVQIINPYKLLVAWNGVLTLAFEAWPKPLADIKQHINELPEFSAKPENFGTRWPKLTLAALNDDAPPLTADNLKDLTSLCHQFDNELQQIGTIPLTHCSIVMFSSRSLEHYLCRVDYAFSSTQTLDDGDVSQEYDEDSYKIVKDVVSETLLAEYIHKVNNPGHRYGNHYNTIWTESTLVCFLTNGGSDEEKRIIPKSMARLLDLMESFRRKVDELLPNYYSWMPHQSLHLSLRALENRSNYARDED